MNLSMARAALDSTCWLSLPAATLTTRACVGLERSKTAASKTLLGLWESRLRASTSTTAQRLPIVASTAPLSTRRRLPGSSPHTPLSMALAGVSVTCRCFFTCHTRQCTWVISRKKHIPNTQGTRRPLSISNGSSTLRTSSAGTSQPWWCETLLDLDIAVL
jgi:hypothetical protein